jgi:hypothetical protein
MNRIALTLAAALLGIGMAQAAEPQAAPQGPHPADLQPADLTPANLQGEWQGTYQCAQDRLHLLAGPFEWQLPFTIKGDQISASRPYLDGNAHLSVMVFTGLVVDQGAGFEIAMLAGEQDRTPNLHATHIGRVTADGFKATGVMLSRHNRILRQCELHLWREQPKPQVKPTGG